MLNFSYIFMYKSKIKEMKKDITLLEEYKSILMNRIKELEEEQNKYQDQDNYTLYSSIQNRILELQGQWNEVQGLIIKNI